MKSLSPNGKSHTLGETDRRRARTPPALIYPPCWNRPAGGGGVVEGGGQEHSAWAAVHEMENQNKHNEGKKPTTAS